MNITPVLERVAEVLGRLPAAWPVQYAALHLVDGYNAHARALAGYVADGRVAPARGDELLDVYRRRLFAQLRRLERSLAAKGGAA